MSIQITGIGLQDEIFLVIASSVFADRETLLLLREDKRYVRNAISKMKADRLILERDERPKMLRVKKQGLQIIKEKSVLLYDYYMRNSTNGRPGMTECHLNNYRKLSQVITMIHLAKISYGIEVVPVWEIYAAKRDKINQFARMFYTSKELLYEEKQKYNRNRMSRACGLLIAPAISAVIYNTAEAEMLFTKTIEKEMLLRMQALEHEISEVSRPNSIKRIIVMAATDEVIINSATRALQEQRKESTKVLLGDVIVNRKHLQADVHYIPITRDGAMLLNVISLLTTEDCQCLCFKQGEREAADSRNPLRPEAVVGDLNCYEFLTSNVTKLAWIKANTPDLSKVGIACLECQVDFVLRFFESDRVKIRCFKQDDINAIINERKQDYDQKIPKGLDRKA